MRLEVMVVLMLLFSQGSQGQGQLICQCQAYASGTDCEKLGLYTYSEFVNVPIKITPAMESASKIDVTVNFLRFFSKFDSGNLAKVELSEKAKNYYKLWIASDCEDRFPPLEINKNRRLWFYFGIANTNRAQKEITLSIQNLRAFDLEFFQVDQDIYVYKSDTGWKRQPIKQLKKKKNDVLKLKVKLTLNPRQQISFFDKIREIRVALCPPWGYEQNQLFLAKIQLRAYRLDHLYYHRDLLCYSFGGLRVEFITLTAASKNETILEDTYGDANVLFPNKDHYRPIRFNKPYIFVTCRVHPAESPASFMMKGLVEFLLEQDPESLDFLQRYVLILIPMLNPDGVIRGYQRLDALGYDQNRIYNRRYKKYKFPAQYAIIETLKYYGDRIKAYFDLHAHVGVYHTFIIRNQDQTIQEKIERIAYLMSSKLPHFAINPVIEDKAMKHRIVEQYEGQYTENPDEPPDDFGWHPNRLRNTTTQEESVFKIVEGMETNSRHVVFSAMNINLSYTVETHYKMYNISGKLTKAGVSDFQETGRALARSLLNVSEF